MGRKIFIADDEKDAVDFLKKMLQKRGHTVTVVYDGLEARNTLGENAYDVIFLDCSLPNLTGLELIKEAKEHSPNAKVIIFTGYAAVDENLVKDLGADEFIQKPVNFDVIEKVIAE